MEAVTKTILIFLLPKRLLCQGAKNAFDQLINNQFLYYTQFKGICKRTFYDTFLPLLEDTNSEIIDVWKRPAVFKTGLVPVKRFKHRPLGRVERTDINMGQSDRFISIILEIKNINAMLPGQEKSLYTSFPSKTEEDNQTLKS